MAIVRYFPAEGAPVMVGVHKPVTTIGRALGNDIAIPDPSVAHHHAQIVFNGRDFQLEEVDREGEILINGKQKRRTRLVHGERMTLGRAQRGFSMLTELDAPDPTRDAAGHTSRSVGDIAGLRRLHAFSERLMTVSSVDQLLETLLDDVIQLTGAARGVVLLVDMADGKQGTPRVRASRNVGADAIADPTGAISDSIVRQVIE